jgi:TRAP-type C4-dicarboxylate transport system permease large subunit
MLLRPVKPCESGAHAGDSVVKRKRNPWYGVVWVIIWAAALIYFVWSGMFNQREAVAMFIAWAVLTGFTVYAVVRHVTLSRARTRQTTPSLPATTARNAPCPCGSGKKYKRCCGNTST